MAKRRQFSIHSSDRNRLASVPFDFIAPHYERAEKNHAQSLDRLNSRGGLGLREMWCVLMNRPGGDWRKVTDDEALSVIQDLLAKWEAVNGPH